jgi:negative regulator of flagellin synthesis FlgM
MRLTGLPDATLRTLRLSGASPAGEVNSASAATATKHGHADGIVTTRATSGSVPPVDTDRVEQIRKAIRDGSYPVLPVEIADALIAAKLFGVIEG